jgi:hypothetical protein
MAFEAETTNWSGEGAFTQLLIERLRELPSVQALRVEDAPATRSEADYQFMSNEIFVGFTVQEREEEYTRFGFLRATRVVQQPAMTLAGLEELLTAMADIGAPDYSDEGMLQYLRTERIVPPYQTRGYKLVELVRIYAAGTPRRD